MKIAIEAQRIFRKKKHGMDIVALELIRHLQQIDQENEYFILVRRDKDNTVLSETKNFHIIELPSVAYPVWEQYYLPKAIKKINPDILHCTSNTAPLRIGPEIRLILTLHDILFMQRMPFSHGTWYQRLGNLYRRWLLPKIISRCSRIITVSNFEKEEILKHFNLSASRVAVVHNAYNSRYNEGIAPEEQAFFKEKYHLPKKYLLYLGNTDPKKNITNVLKAFALFCKHSTDRIHLVIPDVSRSYIKVLLRKTGEARLAKFIHLTGYVPNEELRFLYHGASVFLYPSFYESFGIPLLESMACGTPVISSCIGAIPEVAGDAALLIDPAHPAEIANALSRILENKDLYYELSEKGLKRISTFSWHHTAIHTLENYRKTFINDTIHSIKTTIS